MADLLNLGLTGIRSSRNNLSVTGHNITNIDTPGYSRQRAEQLTNTPTYHGYGAMGSGSRTEVINRIVSQYSINQVRIDTSRAKEAEAYLENISQLDNLLSNQNSAPGTALNDFFDAIQTAANDPLSKPARELVLSSSTGLTQRFQTAYDRLMEQNDAINTQLDSVVDRVNELANSIGKLNDEIANAYGQGGGNPPNDLLDRRDEYLRELSEYVDVRAVEQDGQSMNVFIGKGQPLVVGGKVTSMEAKVGSADLGRYDIVFKDPNGYEQVVNSQITGGKLGGLLRFREDVLDPALSELGRTAMVLAGNFNEQHAQGKDLNDDLGGNFFKDINSTDFMQARAREFSTNSNLSSVGNLQVRLTDLEALDASEYRLELNASNEYVLRDLDGNQVGSAIPMTSPVAASQTLDFGMGFEIDVPIANTAQPPISGDKWLISPTRSGASQLESVINEINKIALRGGDNDSLTLTKADVVANSNNDTANAISLDFVSASDVTNIPDNAKITYDDSAGTAGTGGFVLEYTDQDGVSQSVTVDAAVGSTPATLNFTLTSGETLELNYTGGALAASNDSDSWTFSRSFDGGELIQGSQGSMGAAAVNQATDIIPSGDISYDGTDYTLSYVDANGLDQTVTVAGGGTGNIVFNVDMGDGATQTLSINFDSAAAGDSWTLMPEGKSGNANGLELAGLQRDKLVESADGGGSSLQESYSQLVEFVGNKTSQARITNDTNSAILNQSTELRESISGVNMDEEAANLVKFQQAYQAAAQVIAAAQTTFNAILGIGR